MSCLVKCLDWCIPAFKQCFQRCCPCVYRICWGQQWECVAVKTVLGFAFGALLGAALHFGVINHLNFTVGERESFSAALTLVIAVGYALSVQVRCITLLVLPSFFGRHGRSLIASTAIYLLLTGPINNIVVNAKESSRAITCTSSLTFNHSKELFQLLYKPFHDAFKDIGSRQDEIEDDAIDIKREFQKLVREIEGDDVDVQNERKFEEEKKTEETVKKNFDQKSKLNCIDMFEEATGSCDESYKRVEEKCLAKFIWPFNHLLCLPLKFTNVCTVVKVFRRICDTVPAQPDGIIEMFLTVKDGIRSFDGNFKVNLKWQTIRFPDFLNGTTADELLQQMQHEIRMRKQWFDALTILIKSLLSFMFVFVFKSASSYNAKYLKDITFDNVYMTMYFRKIDARRKKLNKRTLLPLKKLQKTDIIETACWALRREEKKSMLFGILKLVMQVVITVVVVFFDHLFFLMLDLVARHSLVDYTFKGQHVIRIGVIGDGVVAKLFKKVLSAFNRQQHSVDQISTNRNCLPHPSPPDRRLTMLIFAAWGTVWLLLYFQAYGLRFRRVICAFFYPKKEKQRVLFLYNEQLKKRVGFMKHLRYKVRQLAKEKKLGDTMGTLSIMQTRWPRLCGCLAVCRLGRRRCLICEEYETAEFQECPTEGCDFIYCKECWMDVKKYCYACKVYDDGSDDDDDEDQFLSESDG